MVTKHSIIESFISAIIYSSIFIILDIILIFVFIQEPNQLLSTLSLVLITEGGLGLAGGGIVASFSGVTNKVGEIIWNSEPWSFKKQKKAEQQAQKLIIIGFTTSYTVYNEHKEGKEDPLL